MLINVVQSLMFRLVLPAALLTGAILRPSFISFVYVILALAAPLLPSLRSHTCSVPFLTKFYICITFVIALLASLCQVAYQVYAATAWKSETFDYRNESDCDYCKKSDFRYWMNQLGFIRVKPDAVLDIIRIVLPESLSLIFALATVVVCLGIKQQTPAVRSPPAHVQPVRYLSTSSAPGLKLTSIARGVVATLRRLSDVAVIFLILFVGIIQPCVLNAVYFMVFLFVMSWYSTYIPFERTVHNKIKRFVILYAAFHFICVYAYQIPYMQTVFEDEDDIDFKTDPYGSFVTRLIGLKPLLQVDCRTWWKISIISGEYWPSVVNFFVVLVMYYLLIAQYCWTRNGVLHSSAAQNSGSSSVHEDLLTESEDGPPRERVELQRITSPGLYRQQVSSVFKGLDGRETITSQGLITVITFMIYHSYVFALLFMMLWSLWYHSVFGLVFLITACILWVFKDTRSAALKVSGAILVYGEFLLMIQYVCSMELAEELKTIKESSVLQTVGLILADNRTKAFLVLGVKCLLCFPLFVLYRHRRRELYFDSLNERERARWLSYGTFRSPIAEPPPAYPAQPSALDESRGAQAVSWFSEFLTKYWIFFVHFILLLISLQSPPVLFTIGYFALFSISIFLFLISLEFYRKSLFAFWTFAIIYTSLVLIAIYTYQFPKVPVWWHSLTGLSQDWNNDIGLVEYNKEGNGGALFVRLLAPVSFFVVAMLQLKFFHFPWSRMVANPNVPVVESNVMDVEPRQDRKTCYEKMKECWDRTVDLLWQFAEVHFAKLVLLILTIIAINDICAMNFVVIAFVSLGACLPVIANLLSVLVCGFLSVFSIARMVYQLRAIPDNTSSAMDVGKSDCHINYSDFYNSSTVRWLGFEKTSYVGTYVLDLIVAIIFIAAYCLILYRQRHVRRLRGEIRSARGIIFPEADPAKWDASLLDMFKFFLNYGYYKFGFEVSLTLMVVVAWVRMDLLGSLLLVWLFLFCVLSRSVCRLLWPFFMAYIAIMFVFQYALYLGFPPIACIEYPWSSWLNTERVDNLVSQNDNLVMFLDLASYVLPLKHNNLVADFFLLIAVACQEYAFRAESSKAPPPAAGDNDSIYKHGVYSFLPENPYYDFLAEQRNFVDFLKIACFMYLHWITVIMVFVAGVGGVSLFALGYIILAFLVLWKGTALYTMKNYKRTLFIWNGLLLYNVAIMFFKVALQLVGCVFVDSLQDLCWIRQLFSIVCVATMSGRDNVFYFGKQLDFEFHCPVQKSETQIGFDTLAFLFLIMQIRILHSYYFQYCMLDFRAEAVLINRGAILTNQLIKKEMKEQNEQQNNKFLEIKDRTAKIRKSYEEQQKHGGSAAFVPDSYAQAKRAGDYYMFDYDPNTDEPAEYIESYAPEVTPGATDSTRLDPAQIIHTAIQRDLAIAKTLHAVRDAELIEDEDRRMIEAVSSEPEDRADATTETRDLPAAEPEEPEPSSGLGEKILVGLRFVKKLFHSCLDWVSTFLNRRSRDHRYVAFVLGKEKSSLKHELRDLLVDTSQPVINVREQFEMSNLACVNSESDISRLEKDAWDNWQQRNVYSRIVIATAYCIAAHTDILCYVIAIIDHARCGGIITLVLPLLIFLWGTLSTPRPPRIFWVVMIGYTELLVIIKFVFQFGSFPWNKLDTTIKNQNSVDYWPGIVGVRKQDFYAFWDVVLLVALFFHRYVSRKMGLWKDAAPNEDDFLQENVTIIEARDEDHSHETLEENSPPADRPVVLSSGDAATECDLESQTNVPHGVGDAADAPADDPETEKTRGFFTGFIYRLFHPKYRYIRDLYPFMFMLDVLCFFIIVFGFSSFGYGGSGSVVKDIQTNRVPVTFVVMLIVLSIMIVIDRALYLRKTVLWKVVYQLATVIFLHIWIFYLLPQTITYQPSWQNRTAQVLYVVKCIYLLVSAWQIRNGYPSLCVGNLITHAYGFANMIMFKVFMCIPFLFELRTSIDWAWTDTSMPIFDFFNMENFFATIYSLKCARTNEQNFPAKRGEAKSHTVKYAMGIPVILILILILWAPLIAFAFLNRIGTVLMPVSVQMTISLEGYPPLYSVDAQGIELETITSDEYKKITSFFVQSFDMERQESWARKAVAFIQEYGTGDIQKIRFRPESESFWEISSDSLIAMKYELEQENKTVYALVKLRFERSRGDDSKEPIIHTGQIQIALKPGEKARSDFAGALNPSATNRMVTLPQALPPYVIIPNEGEFKSATALHAVMYESAVLVSNTAYSDLNISLQYSNQSGQSMLWSSKLVENEVTRAKTLPLEPVKYKNDPNIKYVQMVAFVDRIFPAFISKFAQGGIIAMYIALVLLIWQKVRGILTNQPLDVIISEIPNPDHLLKICQDIYLVREAKDFILEQDLYAKLIFLFRSPSTLIRWTRYKVKAE